MLEPGQKLDLYVTALSNRADLSRGHADLCRVAHAIGIASSAASMRGIRPTFICPWPAAAGGVHGPPGRRERTRAVGSRPHSVDRQPCRWLLLSVDGLQSAELTGYCGQPVQLTCGKLPAAGATQRREGPTRARDRRESAERVAWRRIEYPASRSRKSQGRSRSGEAGDELPRLSRLLLRRIARRNPVVAAGRQSNEPPGWADPAASKRRREARQAARSTSPWPPPRRWLRGCRPRARDQGSYAPARIPR